MVRDYNTVFKQLATKNEYLFVQESDKYDLTQFKYTSSKI